MPVHDWSQVVSGIFHLFHQNWITKITTALNDGILPPDLFALAEQVADGPHPDVVALESPRGATADMSNNDDGGGALAVLDHPPKVKYTEEIEREIYAQTTDRVAIFHASWDRVVAFIEIVSPGNKHSQYELTRFLDRLNDALERGIHLLIVDVHPPGSHDPRGIHAAFWELRSAEAHGVSNEEPLGLAAYRCDRAASAYFEPVSVGKSLPDMPVFLTPDYYVNVPLEQTYADSWRGLPNRWKSVIERRGTGEKRDDFKAPQDSGHFQRVAC